jgi:predicted dehydrogenase
MTTYEMEWDWSKTFVYSTQHFVECIVNDKTPMVTGEDGKRVIEIIMACYKSAEKGTTIQL